MEEENLNKLKEEEEEERGVAFVGQSISRIKKAEEIRNKVDTALDLKDKAGELKDSVTNAQQAGGHFWAYVGVAVAATPIVLFGLNKYFDFKINPAYYFDRVKGQIEKYTQGETITLSGSIGAKNQGTANEYFYCMIDAANLSGEATIAGEVTGPGGFRKTFSLKTGTPGARFGGIAQNQIVFEFEPESNQAGKFICGVVEMLDAGGKAIGGAAGTVAVLNVQ